MRRASACACATLALIFLGSLASAPGAAAQEEAVGSSASSRLGAPTAAPVEPSRAQTDLPTLVADRPLTLPGGTHALRSALGARFGSQVRGGALLVPFLPMALTLSPIDDLDLGVTWTLPGDPGAFVLGRLFHDEVIEFGVRGWVRVPAYTNGTTVVGAELPLVLHVAHVLRVATGVALEVVLGDPPSPLLFVPMRVDFSLSRYFFLGLEGSVGVEDGTRALGDVGGHIGFTIASQRFPILDLVIGTQVLMPSGAFAGTITHVFYPR